MSDHSFTETMHPADPAYMLKRQDQINRLLKLTPRELDLRLRYEMSLPAPRDESGMSKRIAGEMFTNPAVPEMAKNILGTSAGSGLTDGSSLIRQDLEPVLYALYANRAYVQ